MSSAGTPRALVAPDSFKGTLDAGAVAAALARGFERAGWAADVCPLGDGGEGTAAALRATLGGRWVAAAAHDPLGRPIEAGYTLLGDGESAVVEVATAGGLGLLAADERDPLAADSAGTGELIAAAARAAPTVIVAAGGSATNDGGAGALAALERAGGIDGTRLVCLCDVRTPWERASATFGPQKGADPATVARLERRLDELAQRLPRDPRGVPGGGAAGGLAGALWAAHGARLVPGAAHVCDAVGLDGRLGAVALAVTGEGRLDATTAEGKVVSEVARRAGAAGVAVDAVVGSDASSPELRARLGLRSVIEARDRSALERAAAALAVAPRG